MSFFKSIIKRITNRNEPGARPVNLGLYDVNAAVGRGPMPPARGDGSRQPNSAAPKERVIDPRRWGLHGIETSQRATDYSKIVLPSKGTASPDPFEKLERRQVKQMREIAQRENARASGVYGVMTPVARANEPAPPGADSGRDAREAESGIYGKMFPIKEVLERDRNTNRGTSPVTPRDSSERQETTEVASHARGILQQSEAAEMRAIKQLRKQAFENKVKQYDYGMDADGKPHLPKRVPKYPPQPSRPTLRPF